MRLPYRIEVSDRPARKVGFVGATRKRGKIPTGEQSHLLEGDVAYLRVGRWLKPAGASMTPRSITARNSWPDCTDLRFAQATISAAARAADYFQVTERRVGVGRRRRQSSKKFDAIKIPRILVTAKPAARPKRSRA